jgi:hypothetical protein
MRGRNEIPQLNGLDPSLLFALRRKATAFGMEAPSGGSPSRPARFKRFKSMRSGKAEIVMGDAMVRAGGDVEPDRLPMWSGRYARHDPGRRVGSTWRQLTNSLRAFVRSKIE